MRAAIELKPDQPILAAIAGQTEHTMSELRKCANEARMGVPGIWREVYLHKRILNVLLYCATIAAIYESRGRSCEEVHLWSIALQNESGFLTFNYF